MNVLFHSDLKQNIHLVYIFQLHGQALNTSFTFVFTVTALLFCMFKYYNRRLPDILQHIYS